MNEVGIYNSQEEYILKKFGEEAAKKTNYGWAIDGDFVSTKVYGFGVLTSWIEENEVKHDFIRLKEPL